MNENGRLKDLASLAKDLNNKKDEMLYNLLHKLIQENEALKEKLKETQQENAKHRQREKQIKEICKNVTLMGKDITALTTENKSLEEKNKNLKKCLTKQNKQLKYLKFQNDVLKKSVMRWQDAVSVEKLNTEEVRRERNAETHLRKWSNQALTEALTNNSRQLTSAPSGRRPNRTITSAPPLGRPNRT